ncbi:hypothetical protein Tco_0247333 [Tanacetum coccineum]
MVPIPESMSSFQEALGGLTIAVTGINESIKGILLQQGLFNDELARLRSGESASNEAANRTSGNNNNTNSGHYGRMTKIDFLKFYGKDVKEALKRFGVVFENPMVELKNLKHDGTMQQYQELFEALLNRCKKAPSWLLNQGSGLFEAALPNALDEHLTDMAQSVESVPNNDVIAQISLNALTRIHNFQTMRVKGVIGKQAINILVDCRSTHNFVDLLMAKRIGCRMKSMYPLQVSIVNGEAMTSTLIRQGLSVTIKEITYVIDAIRGVTRVYLKTSHAQNDQDASVMLFGRQVRRKEMIKAKIARMKCTALSAFKRFFLKTFTKSSNKPERTLNRRLRRRNRRGPFERRDERPAQPRIVYLPILNINYFCHFIDILENYNLMDDDPIWAADRVVAPTPASAITIPETANEFAIKGNHLTLVKGNQFDDTFMDLKTKLETTTKNHQALIQNLEAKFDRLADKQSGRPSGSLPSNSQPNPKGSSSKPYKQPQDRNEHANVVFMRSGKSYDPPINPNDRQNDYETPINFDSEDEEEESTPQPKSQTPKPVKESLVPKPYKPKILYPQRLRKEKMEAQYGKFLDMIRVVRINVPLVDV